MQDDGADTSDCLVYFSPDLPGWPVEGKLYPAARANPK
jgi:hypothetical protein